MPRASVVTMTAWSARDGFEPPNPRDHVYSVAALTACILAGSWLRERDSHPRPFGYEPNELLLHRRKIVRRLNSVALFDVHPVVTRIGGACIDSNSRDLAVYRFSRPAVSATHPTLRSLVVWARFELASPSFGRRRSSTELPDKNLSHLSIASVETERWLLNRLISA